MSFLTLDDHVMCYRDTGTASRPAVLMAHPLGMSQMVWDDVTARLGRHFRLVTWDLPGHGASACAQGPLSAPGLARHVVMLAEALNIDTFHFVGTSIGGVIGQQLLLDAPERMATAVLTNTGPVIGTPENWATRAARVRGEGLASMAAEISSRWFGASFVARAPAALDGWTVQLGRTDDEGYAQCCELLAEADFRGRLGGVGSPVHLLAGSADVATPPQTLADLAGELKTAEPVILDGVGHVPSVEYADPMCRLLAEWFGLL